MRILYDADVLAYACGGATQRTRYDVGAEYPDGTQDSAILDSMEEVRAWKAEAPEGTEFALCPLVEAEPESHAIHLVKKSLQAVEKAMDYAGVKFERLELFMTGDGNFREKIATIKPYKGNRDRNARPYHYSAIRRYLSRAWGAKTVCGYEADDALAMEAHKDRDGVVIVSADKDLKNVPGKHYDARKKLWFDVTPEQASLHFYMQLLTGDPVDAILGCYKVGPKKAEGALTVDLSDAEKYARCLKFYEDSLKTAGCPYVGLGAEGALRENAILLHLLRFEGDLWNPPTN